MATKQKKKQASSLNKTRALVGLALLALSFVLAWISNSFASLAGWWSFAGLLVILAGVTALAWRVLQAEKAPRWLVWLALGAIAFRLALSILWLLGLPAWGYDTDVQAAGYVMQDAFNRDSAAWQLAQSGEPLWKAFAGYSITDQYGGLLFLSAAIYKYLAAPSHMPILTLLPSAAVSGLAVAFAWAAGARAFGKKVAWLAAWGLALYPEAALLGSSQMREAFTVCLLPMVLLGVQQVVNGPRRLGWQLLLVSFAAAAFLSWPFVSSLLLFAVITWLALTQWQLLRDKRIWLGLGALALVAGLYFFVFSSVGDTWLVQSADWQVYVSENSSGWVARQFQRMPLWAQVPFLVTYGLVRPLLPAALTAGGPVVWTVIGVWRAVGWTAVLALLAYATYLVLRTHAWLQLPGVWLLASWAVSIVASYRGGGDLWDNPRYRSAFASVQILLAAWAWVQQQKAQDPWLRRSLVSALILCAWFIPWYLRRYVGLEWWPIVEIHHLVGIGLASCALYVLWDWLRA
ncbi:MAG: hypothetical protein KIS88_09390 [Anaerolineales bacterium]|nr:hypothetical protein [Anaerolineales bacterium]